MSKYQAIIYTDPYDIGVCNTLVNENLGELLEDISRLDVSNFPVVLLEMSGKRWKELPRSAYIELNKLLGRF